MKFKYRQDKDLLEIQGRVYKSTCFGILDANDGKSLAERLRFLEDEMKGFLPGFEHPVLEMASDSIFVDIIAAVSHNILVGEIHTLLFASQIKIISEQFVVYLTGWDESSGRKISFYEVGIIYNKDAEFYIPPPSHTMIAIGMRARGSDEVRKKWIAIADEGLTDL